MLTFATDASALYLLLRAGNSPSNLAAASISGQPNKQAKTLGEAQLGMPRGY